jgi:glycosyltransferase involved in cell wall biosynthesis
LEERRPGRRRIAYFVAPYSPVGRSDLIHLGAAAKIESLLRILSSLGYSLRLINSAHNETRRSGPRCERRTVGGVRLIEITPPTYASRKIGKLLNLFSAWRLGIRLRRSTPTDLTWIYNGYAFESLFALVQKPPVLVTEIEDLPFSRRRGWLEIKDWLDRKFLHKVLARTTLVTIVHRDIPASLPHFTCETLLVPSILRDSLLLDDFKNPFSSSPYRLGYFGGLSREKGADLLLSLADVLPEHWDLVITGTGELSERFHDLSRRNSRITFVEAATEQQLTAMIRTCDALLNPHASISAMGNGIFPFKIFEYLSTRRLVISTPLPHSGLDLDRSIVWISGGLSELLKSLQAGEEDYALRKDQIFRTSETVRSKFSESSIAAEIAAKLLCRETTSISRS